MKKAKHHFNLESRANKNGERLIYINLSYGYMDTTAKNNIRYTPMRLSTKYTIKDEYWDGEPNYRANVSYVRRFGNELNNALDTIKKESYAQLSYYRQQNEADPTPIELKRLILEKLKRIKKLETKNRIVDFIKKKIIYRTQLPKSNKDYWKLGTKKLYETLINHIEEYEKDTSTILYFESMSEDIYWNYFMVLNKIRKEETGIGYTETTMHKDYKHLKVIFRLAEEKDIKIGFNYRKKGLVIPAAKASYQTYLNPEQLTKIIETDVSHSIAFTHAKNYIIASSMTALRIGDMCEIHEIKPEHVVYNKKTIYCFTTKIRKSRNNRTELMVTIPILKPLKDLLDGNDGKFPSFPAKSKINKNIKKLLKFLEFDSPVELNHKYYLEDEDVSETKPQHEVFTAHDCRRTFISNLKALGLHNDDIEPITHPKIKDKSIIDLYDNTPDVSKAFRLISELENTNSIYCYISD